MSSTITLEQLLHDSKLEIEDAEFLIEKLTGLSNTELFLKKNNYRISQKTAGEFKLSEKKIISGIPIQYIAGKCDFYGREFEVNKNVLIPRAETELLVEQAIKYIIFSIKYLGRNPKIIDIGTGSGCIIISLFKELNTKYSILNTKYFATDISPAALRIARKNAKKYHVKIKFYISDLLSNPRLPKKFDLILANLPYLPGNYLKENDNLKFEPKLALSGGRNGYEIIWGIIPALSEKLTKNGLAILEIDPRQKSKLRKYLENITKLNFIFKKDLNGRIRYLLISKKQGTN